MVLETSRIECSFTASWIHLRKYELSSEVDGVQFVCLLQISPLLLYQALDGILQLLPVTQQHLSGTERPNVRTESL